MSAGAKARILAEMDRRYWSDPDYSGSSGRRSLDKLEPAWFDIAEETAGDREYSSVMRQLRDLLEAGAEQRAKLHRERLCLVPAPTTDPTEGE